MTGSMSLPGVGWLMFVKRELADEQQLFVEGRLQTRGWEDERGKQYYHAEVLAHEIIVLDGN